MIIFNFTERKSSCALLSRDIHLTYKNKKEKQLSKLTMLTVYLCNEYIYNTMQYNVYMDTRSTSGQTTLSAWFQIAIWNKFWISEHNFYV